MNRKEIISIMPVNADDIVAAKRIIEMGHPSITPVMRDMVRWMRVAESPVADAFAAFFGRLGEPAVDVIAEGLMKDNCWLKHRIFNMVLPGWPPDAIRKLANVLKIVVTHPDAYDNDLRSVEILVKYNLADLQWLHEWISFKKERLAIRNELLIEVEEQLKSKNK
jgi:hypothetical protein